ncbi:hypothetical protein ZWY2020_009349 [Hordeum vulgare]|nr:hypothetical protein ZWY2020_009349 [Hordeum vulgare]
MFVSLTYICFNFVLYPTNNLFAKQPQAYAIFNPIMYFMVLGPNSHQLLRRNSLAKS